MLPLLPATTNDGNTLNYAYNSSHPVLNTTYSFRVDQTLSERSRITATYSWRKNQSVVGLRSLPLPLDPGHQNISYTTDYARIVHDYTFSPSLVNQLALGFNRFDSLSQMPTATQGVNWDQKLGISNVSGFDFPQLLFSDPIGYSTLGSNINNNSIDNGYRINDGLTKVFGKHTIQFGGNATYQNYSPFNFANQQGSFTFSTNQTAPLPNFGPTAGNAFASFLLSDVSSATATNRSSQPQWRYNYYALYIQDNYQVNPSLTLNLGLRWDVDTPRRELHNRTSSFDPTALNPQAGNLPGALVFATPNDRSFTSTYFKDFAPRAGFAWSPRGLHGKFAFRGGYGIYYSALFYPDGGNRTQQGYTATPFFNSQDLFTPAFNISSGFPAYTPAPIISPGFQNNSGIDYVAGDQNKPGYVQNWSFQVQQQLATDLLFSLGYVGSKGTRLNSNLVDPNALQPQYLGLGSLLTQNIGSPAATAAGFATPPYPNYGGKTVGQSLRPFPQYLTIDQTDLLEHQGFSTYHALEAQLTRRFHNGLNLSVAYTWSKSITDSDVLLPWLQSGAAGGTLQNPFNRAGEKSISNEDTPQVLALSYIYELPVGKGRKFFGNLHGWANALAGGWQVSAVQHYQSGQPIAFGCATPVPYLDACTRFDYVSGQSLTANGGETGSFNPFNPARNTWLNRAAFVDPNPSPAPNVPYQFGNISRVTDAIRTQPYFNEDFALAKKFAFSESGNVEFRAESFNTFNRHTFNAGNTTPSAATFGQVTSTVTYPRQLQLTLKINF